MAGELAPDVLIGIDVNHDYTAAPGIGDRNMQLKELILAMDAEDVSDETFQQSHPRLDETTPLTHQGFAKLEKKG